MSLKPLPNVQASCFINTVIQYIFSSSQFNKYLLQAIQTDKQHVFDDPVLKSYCYLTKSLVNDNQVDMKSFVNQIRSIDPRWNGTNDSFEFLQFIIDRLESIIKFNITLIHQKTFYTLQCGHVGIINDSASTEDYLYTSQLTHINTPIETQLDYKCSKCNDTTIAHGRTIITKLPPVLVFNGSASSEVPIDIQMTDSEGQYNYQLRALFVYVPGHYFAVLNLQDKWYICNDTHISLTDSIKRINARTYIYEMI